MTGASPKKSVGGLQYNHGRFSIFDNLFRNSGVKVKICIESKKAPAKIACMLRCKIIHQILTRPPIGPI
jgi:hypothetical protein